MNFKQYYFLAMDLRMFCNNSKWNEIINVCRYYWGKVGTCNPPPLTLNLVCCILMSHCSITRTLSCCLWFRSSRQAERRKGPGDFHIINNTFDLRDTNIFIGWVKWNKKSLQTTEPSLPFIIVTVLSFGQLK